MYKEFETRASYNYLKEVISNLKEPICILGGWAVFFHVNKRFEKAQGRPYLGSRDIDLGFHIGKSSTSDEMAHSDLMQAITVLRERLGFKPLSFRLFKELHTETEEEIKKGQMVPAHFVFPMYVDLVVDNIPTEFRKAFGFSPIDEPLLAYAFDSKEDQSNVKEFGRNVLLPGPVLLLAMKINSLPNRDKEHKKTKDICDMFALLWYSSINTSTIKKDVQKYVSGNKIAKAIKSINQEDLQKSSLQIGHSAEEIERVLNIIK